MRTTTYAKHAVDSSGQELLHGPLVHCFLADDVSVASVSHNDPDGEVDLWRWVQLPPAALWTPESLPEDVRGNLHAPRSVLLALLGLGSDTGLSLVRPNTQIAYRPVPSQNFSTSGSTMLTISWRALTAPAGND